MEASSATRHGKESSGLIATAEAGRVPDGRRLVQCGATVAAQVLAMASDTSEPLSEPFDVT
jgi:hypothetical protein